MLTRVLASVGGGKKEYLLARVREAFEQGRRVYVIVPEQITAQYEEDVVALCGPESNDGVEVTNFSRLPDVVLRTVGNLARKSLSEEEKKLLLFECLTKNAPALPELAWRGTARLIDELYADLEEMRLAGLDLAAVKRLASSPHLKEKTAEKMNQIAVLLSTYEAALEGRFDDPADEETRLYKTLGAVPFFAGATVVIDGFWDFTAPQEALIRRFLEQAGEVFISFVARRGDSALFALPLRAARRCLRLAGEIGCEVKTVVLETDEPPTALSFVRNRFLIPGQVFDGEPEGVSLTVCTDAVQEADEIAREAYRLAETGAAWREIAVLSRTEENEEAFVQALEERGVPVWCERKKPLASSLFAKTVLLGAAIALGDTRGDTVREYLQCAALTLSEDDRFLLEQYAATWDVSGRVWLEEKDFEQNPDGYGALDARAEEILGRVNSAKRAAFEPVRRLSAALSAGKNAEKVSALVAFLGGIGAEKVLLSYLDTWKKEGDFERAGEISRAWNTVLERLSGLARTLGEEESSSAHFLDLLRIALSGSLPGAVPPGQDRVLVGQLGFARPAGVRHVILADLVAGVFPKAEKKDSLFSSSEREALCELGYALVSGERAGDRENFLFYLAAAMAKDSLSLYAYRDGAAGGLSLYAGRVTAMFPRLTVRKPQNPPLPQTRADAFAYYAALDPQNEDKRAMDSFFADDPAWIEKSVRLNAGRAWQKEPPRLKEEKPYAGRDANMSYTRMETFSKCPFSYFAQYTLDLKESKRADFGTNLVGSFVHAVMELVFSRLAAEERGIAEISDEELKELNDAACRDALTELIGKPDDQTRFLARQMAKNTLAILKNLRAEFAASHFTPIFFEKKLEDLGGYRVPLADGRFLCLYGSIDRVDAYEGKDGNTYVRVVDYKTGTHGFSLDGVANGVDLQMLIYLFALWDGVIRWNGKDVRALPAGILYVNGMAEEKTCSTRQKLEEEGARAYPELERRGLVLNDPILLAAHDPLQKDFLPASGRGEKIVLVSRDELAALKKNVEKYFARLATQFKNGVIDALPLYESGKNPPCSWCAYRPICRNDPKHFRPWRSGCRDELFDDPDADPTQSDPAKQEETK